MTDITVYQPPPPTHPARELAAALLRRPATWAVVVTLLAFGLRVVALANVPPGWRDDELIETLVISRNILGGDLRFYYPDASGHEALYHALNALFLAWFGPGALGIRLLSAFLGTLAVPLTYALARRLFSPAVGLTAAALLAVSFWGLMYSRVGIRHVTTPVLALAAFWFFWQAMQRITNYELRITNEEAATSLATRHSPPATRPRSPAPLLPCASSPPLASASASASTATSPRAARRSSRWPFWATWPWSRRRCCGEVGAGCWSWPGWRRWWRCRSIWPSPPSRRPRRGWANWPCR